MRHLPTHPKRACLLRERARILRSRLTPSETVLWHALRQKKLGVRFDRQVVCGRFVADFIAPRAGLIVEVDGESHIGREKCDARRDEKLGRLGYRVLRIPAELVMHELGEALARIPLALALARAP